MKSKKIFLSIIISVYNEEKNIKPLCQELMPVIRKLKKPCEVIFVDDGSDDRTLSQLIEVKKNKKEIIIVQLQGNFGKASALQAGFDQAQGEYIITLDGDLQDDPKEIPSFIREIKKPDYDLVCGWKYKRKDPLGKIIFSKIANFLARRITGIKIHDMNCGFKAYKKKTANSLHLYGEMHRYIPALVAKKGFGVKEIKVNHYPRQYGKSKYGAGRLLRGFFDFITVVFLTRYTKRPLHLFGSVGLLAFLIGLAINIYITILWFGGLRIGHRPLLILGVLLMVIGAQFISLGLLGEMITAAQPKEKNQYLIKRVVE